MPSVSLRHWLRVVQLPVGSNDLLRQEDLGVCEVDCVLTGARRETCAVQCLTDEEVEALIQAGKDASFLQSELPPGAVEEGMEKLFMKPSKTLARYLTESSKSKQQVSLACMQRVLAEGSISFPSKKELEECKTDLAKELSKQQQVLEAFRSFTAGLAESTWKDQLDNLVHGSQRYCPIIISVLVSRE